MKISMEKSNIVPVLVLCVVIFTILFIPFKVISMGYLPSDDALRHAAKVVSGKNWNDILVLREGVLMDSHPGWHAILTLVYKATGCSTEALVVFSVVLLSLLFLLTPLFFLDRREAWLITILTVSIADFSLIYRLFYGRPYIFTMFTVVMLGFLWPRLKLQRASLPVLFAITLLIALSTWIHCLWYLFALPIVCFFIAGRRQEGLALCVCTFIGVILGAIFTGQPILFFQQTVSHGLLSLANHALTIRILVTEFQPFNGDFQMVVLVIGILAWRYKKGSWKEKTVRNPIFVLGFMGWMLGFVVNRFWSDWGFPAIAVCLAQEFQEAFEEKTRDLSLHRAGIASILAITSILSITNDHDSRWSYALSIQRISAKDPDLKDWLPGPGGIIYSYSMQTFYNTFYQNPTAPWRYILGYEPGLMPADDLAILRKIQWNFGAAEGYAAWVKKMRPEDRLVIGGAYPPNIPELQWHLAVTGVWIGRLPLKPKALEPNAPAKRQLPSK